MDIIARCGLKTDLHIHSYISAHKDKRKVKDNTLSNLNILVSKLKENQVNICALTDHDAFSYELYQALKEEEIKDNCIMKVFPGVEFSVHFETKDARKTIHIVTIFNDTDREKVRKIEQVLKLINGKPAYDVDLAFSEDKYISILKAIDLDTVMIAHQKGSLASTRKSEHNDASILGQEKLNEFLFFEYFEAYEFRNKKNEIFNKNYVLEKEIDESLRMITGSDCHQWSVYPKETENSTSEYAFTYIKCLPSFKGLVMAVTDSRRIKLENSFFCPTEIKLNSISLRIKGRDLTIPLSPGINVIIGDNSVGKSLLLHKINDDRKQIPSSVKIGYNKYLKENDIEVLTKIDDNTLFRFDAQGEVRKQFEEKKLKASEFLQPYFPPDISPKKYRQLVDDELQRLYNAIQSKFEFDQLKKALIAFRICINNNQAQSITFIQKLKPESEKEYREIFDRITEIVNMLNPLKNLNKFDASDAKLVKDMRISLIKMQGKYSKKCQDIQDENRRINIVKTIIMEYRKKYIKLTSDEHKVNATFVEDISDAVDSIVNVVLAHKRIIDFKFNLSPQKICPMEANVSNYKFISKLSIEEISNIYLESVLNKVLKTGKRIIATSITKDTLRKIISFYPENAISELDALRQKITAQLDDDFAIKHAIIKNKMDVYKELSDGLNAQIYFALITGEIKNKGIYVIDQPEDHVSPKAIKDQLLTHFKDMGETRQVIMVTHSPQFIVNLDVDNVIFIFMDETHSLKIASGALEYEDDDYNILQIVADNIEGGLNTIARRLKRYEKGTQLET